MKFWLVLVFISGFLLGFTGNKVWEYDQIPNSERDREQDIRQVLGRDSLREPTESPTGELKYRGKYFGFNYPAGAKKLENRKLGANILEKVDLEMKNPRVGIIGSVTEATEANLDEIPGVSSRKLAKDKYVDKAEQISGESALVFTSLDGKEVTAFILVKGKLFTLAVVGVDRETVKRVWNKLVVSYWTFI